jgi:hypothetical protein
MYNDTLHFTQRYVYLLTYAQRDANLETQYIMFLILSKLGYC